MHDQKYAEKLRPPAPRITLPGFLTVQADGVTLAVKVQPRAPKNEVGEALGPELRLKVSAAPVDAAANEAVIRLLAEKFDCQRGAVRILRGHTSRHKVIKLQGLTAAQVIAKLTATK
jgi:uncharacterized protein (TIGR00251 family)